MTATQRALSREQLFRWFFFAVFAALLWQLARVFSPFFTGLLWGAILTVAFYPLHAWLLRRKAMSQNMAALISTACVLLVFIIPLLFFTWILVREAAVVYPAVQEWVHEFQALGRDPQASVVPQSLRPLFDRFSGMMEPLGVDIQGVLLKNVNAIATAIAEAGSRAARNLFLGLFNLFILAIAVFVFFRNGSAWIRWALGLVPMEDSHKHHLLERVNETFSAVLRGMFAVAVLQGFLAGVGFYFAGVRFPVLLSLITFLTAFIPIGGTFLVWGPISGYMVLKGLPYGIPLALWCLVMVSLVDNALKALIIGQKAKLPIVLLFFALLGGIATYGFVGILLGPVLVTCALAFIRIYREEYNLKGPSEVEAEEG